MVACGGKGVSRTEAEEDARADGEEERRRAHREVLRQPGRVVAFVRDVEVEEHQQHALEGEAREEQEPPAGADARPLGGENGCSD